ncbi:CLUMA_CG003026, isoform A [Clunio marinus]|uniref:Fatty acid 2-hydroxylase n=1 Tax=Clunio marinus TaxID=568069 RepID=A0A1J1HMU2_9DIPT|nr:CLUMA_CG003026, isoform A [Clunio marinus]
MNEKKFIVEYKNQLYDITKFLSKHPGGVNTLIGYNRRNIEEKFLNVEHSPAAEYLLKDYRVKSDNQNFISDESLEVSQRYEVYHINWNAALLPQINQLGDKYSEWVNKPIDRKLRLFKNPLLETLSKTPWYLPLIFWTPIIVFLITNEFIRSPTATSFMFFLNLFSGVVLWTLVEYILHRFLFHMTVQNYPNLVKIHFMLHGLHHKVPFDEQRLVFPPVPAAILSILLYQPIVLLNHFCGGNFYNSRLILAGGLIGYLCYDMIHFYIHHGSPTNKYFYHLKRYHYNHHFVNHDKGFGISSPLWDGIFGTKLFLKKLKYLLKW